MNIQKKAPKEYKRLHKNEKALNSHVERLKNRNADIQIIPLFNGKKVKTFEEKEGMKVRIKNPQKPNEWELRYSFPFVNVNAENYHIKTTGTWKIIAVRNNATKKFKELIAKHGLNYNSSSGSKYVTTKIGIYRYSDHWGSVASCNWRIENYPKWLDKQKAYFLAFIKYTDLKSSKRLDEI